MAFQAAPPTNANTANQNFAQMIVSFAPSPAAGAWQAAPRPQAVNQPAPAVFTGP